MYDFDFSMVTRFWPQFLTGLATTLWLSALTFAVSLLGGLIVVLMRTSRRRPVALIAVTFTEIFRGVPLLVLLVWIYYVLPILTSISISVFWTAILGIGLQMAAFVAEDYRAGLAAIPSAQGEAARALGMSSSATFRRILMPQALRIIVGPLINNYIVTLKGTALLAVLSFPELMYVGMSLTELTFRPLEILTVVGALYFLIAVAVSALGTRLERRFAREF